MPHFYARLTVATYAALLSVTLLVLLIGGTAVAQAYAGVSRNDDWTPVVGMSPQGIEYVLVPAGCFMMGSTQAQITLAMEQCKAEFDESLCPHSAFERELPAHEICFDVPFWISRYEITNAQYQRCVQVGACTSNYQHDRMSSPQQPVVGLIWDEAQAFAAWAMARLPTEAQWEYAARGPDEVPYPWGDATPSCDLLNYWTGSNYCVGTTTARGQYSPQSDSWVGAADMAGNTSEWTSSIPTNYPYDADDGREDQDATNLRIVRGGTWQLHSTYARSASRSWASPNDSFSLIGMRLVVTFAPSQ